MGTGAQLKAVPAESADITESLTLRGKKYVIRELNAKQYEEIISKATKPDANGDLDTDMNLLAKFMVLEATTVDGEPLDIMALGELPQPVYAKLRLAAQRIHWTELQSAEEAEEAAKKAAKEKAPSS